jgi:hypothetical protein
MKANMIFDQIDINHVRRLPKFLPIGLLSSNFNWKGIMMTFSVSFKVLDGCSRVMSQIKLFIQIVKLGDFCGHHQPSFRLFVNLKKLSRIKKKY